jgi:hypothetical protein
MSERASSVALRRSRRLRERSGLIGDCNAQFWAEHEAEEAAWHREKANRRRLRREHGAEGLALISKLVDRVLMAHPGMDDVAAWDWAEGVYLRGDVLC